MLERRTLLGALALPLLASPSRAIGQSGKAPYRLLYDNDLTNILSVTSPYHRANQPFAREMLNASVDEAAGADVQLLQPGLGWIPFWKSAVYPIEEHWRWYSHQNGRDRATPPNPLFAYMLGGGDITLDFVRRCRERGSAPFISLRLNDAHQLDFAGTSDPHAIWASRFYIDHLPDRIGSDVKDWNQRVLNWQVPAVREQKLAFVKEIAAYDIDGLELDFMRQPSFFRQNETTSDQRAAIMTEFVGRARAALDAHKGRRRWLCVRVPAFLAIHDRLGIRLDQFTAAGVDMINLSDFAFTTQQSDLPTIRAMVPEAAVYLEMTQALVFGKKQADDRLSVAWMATPTQLLTTAELARKQGADGVSLFNFVYYRQFNGIDQAFAEPPFAILPKLKGGGRLAARSYFSAIGWRETPTKMRLVPKRLNPGRPYTFSLDVEPLTGPTRAVFRFQLRAPLDASRWAVSLNGQAMAPVATDLTLRHDEQVITFVNPANFRSFEMVRPPIVSGPNTIAIALDGSRGEIVDYIELMLLPV